MTPLQQQAEEAIFRLVPRDEWIVFTDSQKTPTKHVVFVAVARYDKKARIIHSLTWHDHDGTLESDYRNSIIDIRANLQAGGWIT